MMKVLRTPDSQFENLPDFDFEPTYTTIRDEDGTELRIHSVDLGPRDADPILLMHGNPTWSYLYRHMIPRLLESGRRVIAVDLVGCGRSDKPARRSYYTLARHKAWMTQWMLANNLKNITLFCQDWGGVLGLDLVARYPERFDHVAVSNSGIPTGDQDSKFLRWWLRLMKFALRFPWKLAFLGAFKGRRPPSEAEYQAFRAPFPAGKYEAGILKFPQLITVFPDHPEIESNREAWRLLAGFDKPFITLFGDKDPVTKGGDKRLQQHVQGCQGQNHQVLKNVGHFSPEEAPQELANALLDLLGSARKPGITITRR